jgi:hypothetical protein
LSCYFRHIKEVLAEAGIQVTTGNKKEIDRTFHQVVGIAYKDCPSTWRSLKQEWMVDAQKRQELVQKLRNTV